MVILCENLSTNSDQFKAYLFFLSKDIIRAFYLNQNIKLEKVQSHPGKYIHHIPYSSTLEIYVNSITLIMNQNTDHKNQGELVKLKGLELLYYLYNQESKDLIGTLMASQDDEESIIRHTVEKNFQRTG